MKVVSYSMKKILRMSGLRKIFTLWEDHDFADVTLVFKEFQKIKAHNLLFTIVIVCLGSFFALSSYATRGRFHSKLVPYTGHSLVISESLWQQDLTKQNGISSVSSPSPSPAPRGRGIFTWSSSIPLISKPRINFLKRFHENCKM